MGQPKQLLPFGDSTVLQTVIESALVAGLDGLVVVVNPAIEAALDLSADKRFMAAILRPPEAEMVDSVMLGMDRLSARHLPCARDGFLVCPGDMPAIGNELMVSCAVAYRENPSRIIVGARGSKLGHPIVAPFGLRGELDKLHGVGVKGLFEVFPGSVLRIEAADDGALHDIDTPDDYDALRG